jgi:WD40 repeat protein
VLHEVDLDAARLVRSAALGTHFAPTAVTATPDGRTAYVGAFDGVVRVVDLERFALRSAPAGHTLPIGHVSLSADGETVFTSGNDGWLRAHDLATGELRREHALIDPGATTSSGATIGTAARRAAVLRDGERVFAACLDGTLRIVDLLAGRDRPRPVVRERALTDVVASPAGDLLLVADQEGHIHRVDLVARRPDGALRAEASFVTALAFIDDATFVAGRDDGRLEVWRADATAPAQVLDGHPAQRITVLEAVPGRRLVVAATGEGAASCWDVAAGDRVWERPALHGRVVNGLAATGRLVASVSQDARLALTDVDTGALVDELDLSPSSDAPYDVAWLPGARGLVVSTGRGVVLRLELTGR